MTRPVTRVARSCGLETADDVAVTFVEEWLQC